MGAYISLVDSSLGVGDIKHTQKAPGSNPGASIVKMKVAIIGLGNIGSETLKEIAKKDNVDVTGIDIDQNKLDKLKNKYKVTNKLNEAFDVYIISVYSTEQVIGVLNKIDYSKKPLVSVDSTVKPGTYKILRKIVVEKNKSNLILFPHRFNPNDKEHHIFNLKRVMGGATKECLERGVKFFKQFIPEDLIVKTSIEYAELSKVLENAYRFLEIATAEEIKLFCNKNNLDFNELRRCINSKWNIDIKEAREGIISKCLPKDIHFLNEFFQNNKLFNTAVEVDEEYKDKIK